MSVLEGLHVEIAMRFCRAADAVPTGARPASLLSSSQTRLTSNHWKSGSTSPLWYSMDVGPVHVVFLTSYADYGPGSKQVRFLWMNALVDDSRWEGVAEQAQNARWEGAGTTGLELYKGLGRASTLACRARRWLG